MYNLIDAEDVRCINSSPSNRKRAALWAKYVGEIVEAAENARHYMFDEYDAELAAGWASCASVKAQQAASLGILGDIKTVLEPITNSPRAGQSAEEVERQIDALIKRIGEAIVSGYPREGDRGGIDLRAFLIRLDKEVQDQLAIVNGGIQA